MKRLIITTLMALVLMCVQANVDSAFGLDFVCHFGMIAAVFLGVSAVPMMSSSIAMLILALVCDLCVSGPIALFALATMIVFAISRAFLFRFRTERMVAVMMGGALVSIAFDSLLAVLYSIYFQSTVYLSIFIHVFWKNAIVSFVMTPIFIGLVQAVEKLTTARRRTGFRT